jgi:hypothetical protein
VSYSGPDQQDGGCLVLTLICVAVLLAWVFPGPAYAEGVDRPRLNQGFPACAQIARRLLAEVYGCKPGDPIPGEDELLARARQQVAEAQPGGRIGSADGKAEMALAMVREIGGIFTPGLAPELAYDPG